MGASKFTIRRKCLICGEEFFAKTIDSRYCSPRCSKVASKRKADEAKRQERLNEVLKDIPKDKEMITIHEAYIMFGINKRTLYRLVKRGEISNVNMGIRQTLVSKTELASKFPYRKDAIADTKPLVKLYRMEPEDCYTIGEIAKKFRLDDSTVYAHIRKFSIPSRQIGNFVYVPKKEIDNLYKDMEL